MKQFSILALLSCLVLGSVFGQCTITQPSIMNPSVLPGGIAKFDLTFKHIRNGGNKWVTVHLWKSQDYPGYNYDRVPTTARLGGSSSRPFGTVVINNELVDHSGTYTNTQSFVDVYQNDGVFVMLNTSGSTLVYNATTDSYTLKDLQIILPAGTTVIKYDSWSSQSSYNNNVHCFNSNGGTIIVPSVLPVVYSKPFKVDKSNGFLEYTWATSSESNNSHFVIEHLEGSEWKEIATIFCKSENGYSDTQSQYTYRMKIPEDKGDPRSTTLLIGLSVLTCALVLRNFVPARLTILICVVCACALGACNGSKENSLQSDHWYRLKQVNKDGKFTHSDSRMIKF
jgi:hypothetical protein